jgi:O-antigen/teichoic acid export membrane protein
VAGVGLGVGFAAIAPFISVQFAPLRASYANIFVFTAGVSLTTVTTILDQALIGILWGNLQFWRNAFFSVVKLALLFAAGLYLSHTTGMTIYTTWTLGMALSLFVVFGNVLVRKGWQGRAYLPDWTLLRNLGSAALQHHLLNLILQVPMQLLPVLVTTMLSAKMNAWFYVSWMIANFVFLVPNSLTIVLHAMNSAEQSSLRQRARMTVGLSFLFCVVANAVLLLGAKQVLGVFGSAYADQAAWCLRILSLAAFGIIIKTHYISFCRIQDRIRQAMWGMALGGILELGGAALGAYLNGLIGLCLGWVIAALIAALFMFPVVYRVIWSKKGVLEKSLLESDGEMELIWLADTVMLATIPSLHTTTTPRLPTISKHTYEPIWLTDTIVQPAIRPAHSTSTHMPTPPLSTETEPIWRKKTIKAPAITSVHRIKKEGAR